MNPLRGKPGYVAVLLAVGLVGLVLAWSTLHAYRARLDYHRELAAHTAKATAKSLDLMIAEIRRGLGVVSETEALVLTRLADNPDDDRLREHLRDFLGRHFQHFITYTLADKNGRVLVEDFGEDIGELCRADLRRYSVGGEHVSIIHPGPKQYHFDVMLPWRHGDQEGTLFVSFSTEPLVRLLAGEQAPGHKLVLMRMDDARLIEVAAGGSRDRLGEHIRLGDQDVANVQVHGHRVRVADSRWQVVDVPEAGLLAGIRLEMARQLGLILGGMGLLSVVVLALSRRESQRRLAAETALVDANMDLEQRVAERTRALARSEQQAMSIINNAPDAMLLADAAGSLELANDHAITLFGYPREDLVGQHFTLLLPDQSRARFDSARAGLIPRPGQRGAATSLELTGRRRDGGEFPVQVGMSAFQTGGVHKFVFTLQDIGPRKAAEQAVLRAEAAWAAAMNQYDDAIVVIDADSRVVQANRVFYAMTGFTAEQAQGQPVSDIVHPGVAPELCPVCHAEQAGLSADIVLELDAPANTFGCPAKVSVRRVEDTQGGFVGMLVSVHDLTEERAIEAELHGHRIRLESLVAERTADLEAARAEAERLAKVKGEFLANMSHEIRTPLNAVLGFAQLGIEESHGRGSKQTCQRILDAGRHLLGLINDILDYSKIEAGKLALESRPFRIKAMVEDSLELVAGAARAKDLRLQVRVGPEVPEWVMGDPLRLGQVLGNLLSNAIKFTHQGGVSLTVGGRQGRTEFRVVDSGIGMDEEVLKRLFSPFEQADSSTTRSFGGTGLGLAISKQLVTLMGGDIQVASRPGNGSEFTVSLPLPETGPAVEVPVNTGRGARLEGLRILAAEDVEPNRMVLEALLQREGAHVEFAANGREAVDRLEERGVTAFDVVLMDVQMPVMDGYEATRRIRRMAPTLPVIGLTAHALAEERQKCLNAGMVEHATKPIELDALVAAILRHVQRPAVAVENMPSRPENIQTSRTAQETSVPPVAGASSLVDWPALEKRYGHRRDFINKLADTVLTSQAGTPEALRKAVTERQWQELNYLAHSLKGMSGNLHVPALGQLAMEAERAAREGKAGAGELGGRLADLLDRVLAELAERTGLQETEGGGHEH